MLSKKYLDDLMRYHEEKEAKEAESAKVKAALGKFINKNKNNLGEESKIDFFIM